MFICPIVNIEFWVAHIDPIVILHHIKANNVKKLVSLHVLFEFQ